MKTLYFALAVFALGLASTESKAHGTKSEMVSKAVVQALENFEETATGTVLRRFEGVKGYFDGSQIRVKIYLNKPVEEVRMACDEDHETEKLVCKGAGANPEGDGHGDHEH